MNKKLKVKKGILVLHPIIYEIITITLLAFLWINTFNYTNELNLRNEIVEEIEMLENETQVNSENQDYIDNLFATGNKLKDRKENIYEETSIEEGIIKRINVKGKDYARINSDNEELKGNFYTNKQGEIVYERLEKQKSFSNVYI